MAETIKCTCPKCAAKYRLPVEAAGRKARCKRCGDKFEVPRSNNNLEDTILSWLTEGAEKDDLETKPRVISMPSNQGEGDDAATPRRRGMRARSTASGK